MNNANEDDLKKQLEGLIRETNKSSHLSDGDYKMLSREISIEKCNEIFFINNLFIII